MVGFSSGPSGSEQLRFVVDIVAGDQSGVQYLDQLQARVQQLDQVLKAQSKSAQESFSTFAQAGQITGSAIHGTVPQIQSFDNAIKSARESAQVFTQQGLRGQLPALTELNTQVKSAADSYKIFERNSLAGTQSIRGQLPAIRELDTGVKSAKDSFQTFAQSGLTPFNQQLEHSNSGISKWLINAGNIHGVFSNMQGAMANMNPAFQVLGQSVQEIGFGIAGIAMGGPAAALGIANIGAALFKTFTDLGKASGEFYNEMRVGAAVMGMTEKQTYTMRTAMELSGANVQQLQIFVQRLTKAQEDLASGTDNVASRALKKLDVAIVDSNGNLRSSYDLLIDVQQALAAVSNEQERNALTGELAGMRSREVNALLRDFNMTLPIAQQLLAEHSGLFEDLEKKQLAYNKQQAEMKLQWQELATKAGPPYINMLEAINNKIDGFSTVIGGFSASWAGAMAGAVFHALPFISALDAIGKGLDWIAGRNTAAAGPTPMRGSYPMTEEETAAYDARKAAQGGFGATTTVSPDRARELAAGLRGSDLDPWEKGSALYDPDAFKPKGSGSATGPSSMLAAQQDSPAALAAFAEFAKGPFPDFVFQLGKGKQNIKDYTLAGKEWDEMLAKVRTEQLRARIAADELRLAGDHSSSAFVALQARIYGLADAERYLQMKRSEDLDEYRADIELLKQTMQSSRQVVRAMVIDIQGRSSMAGRRQLAGQVDPNYEVNSLGMGGGLQGGNHVTGTFFLVNNGVVTTNNAADWFANMLNQMQRTGRTQLSGTQ